MLSTTNTECLRQYQKTRKLNIATSPSSHPFLAVRHDECYDTVPTKLVTLKIDRIHYIWWKSKNTYSYEGSNAIYLVNHHKRGFIFPKSRNQNYIIVTLFLGVVCILWSRGTRIWLALKLFKFIKSKNEKSKF